jgi:hypothetical protein
MVLETMKPCQPAFRPVFIVRFLRAAVVLLSMVHVPYDSVPSIANFLVGSVLLALPEMLHTGLCRH